MVILGAGASKATAPKGDRQGRELPVLANLAEVVGVAQAIAKAGVGDASDFEALYDQLVADNSHPELVRLIQRSVWRYFADLELPDGATIYDFLLLALRQNDLIASFNWDPLLVQAYCRNAHVGSLPRIIFLHGNVGIGYCEVDRVVGYSDDSCGTCGRAFVPSQLLYPVRQKDYNVNPLIKSEWEVLSRNLAYAYMLTIFGYSAPSTDVEARDIFLNAWRGNAHFELAQINIVDIRPRRDLVRAWRPFFCREHFAIHRTIFTSWLFRNPRRSCEALAMATLQNNPWAVNLFPRFRKLSSLQEWVAPLVAEEHNGRFSGTLC